MHVHSLTPQQHLACASQQTGAHCVTNLGAGGDRSGRVTSWSWVGISQITTIGSTPDNAVIRHLEVIILHTNRVVSVRSLR